MAAEVSSIARMLRGEAGKGGMAGAAKPSEMVTMDLLGGRGGDSGGDAGGEDEVVDLEVKVPAGWERRLDLLSGKTFLIPHRQQATHDGHQDLNLPPTASTAVTTTSAAVCTLDMVRSALERASAARAAPSPDTSSSSSASTSTSSSSLGKRNRSPPSTTASPAESAKPAMSVSACPSCLTYVLIAEADPRCPRCSAKVPPLPTKPAAVGSEKKKPRIDLNAAADETE